MKTILKIVGGLIALVIVAFIGLSIYVTTMDADKYRPQLIQTLSEKTGRKVTLEGPIGFSLGLGGVTVSIKDASIGNPPWASRPAMAGMGKFEVGVSLLPLLTHQVDVKKLAIENADILLETNAAGQHNWTMGAPATATAAPVAKPAAKSTSSGVSGSLSVDGLSITNSQLAMRGVDGKTAVYDVESLTLDMQGSGAVLSFKGSAGGAVAVATGPSGAGAEQSRPNVNATAITLDAKTGITDLLSTSAFPFDAHLMYGPFHLMLKGTADIGSSKAKINSYQLMAGKTTLSGSVSANWGGAHPVVQGKLTSDHIDPADFKSPASASDSNAPATAQKAPASNGRMFSDAPLPLDGLKAVNADLQVNVGELVVGHGLLKNVAAKLVLTGGNLVLAPVTANVGDKVLNAQVKLDASQSPAHLTIGMIGDGVDLGELQKLGSMSPFMSGSASANIQLTGDGNSAHAIASSLGGVITITAEKGEIIGNALSGVSSALASVFNPAGGDSSINCLAIRFIAKGGVLNDNGILIDSAPSTVAGKGNVNLGVETINLTINAKTKLMDVGGLVPALSVGGTLAKPSYSVDAIGVAKNVIGNLMNGNALVTQNGAVPSIQAAPAGQNACVYTLDHPQAAASTSVLPAGAAGKATQKINSLVKGLFGQ